MYTEAELKGEEYAECSILKCKMFKTVLMKESKSMEEWDSQIPMESAWRDAKLLVFMKVQTKSTECYL
jgi:hypothetical protein